MMIDLKFLKSWGAYNAGESARFAPAIAEVLTQKGIASEHSPSNPPETQSSEANVGQPVLSTVRPEDKTKPLGK